MFFRSEYKNNNLRTNEIANLQVITYLFKYFLSLPVAPLSVSLVNRPQQLIAGAASTLRCIAEGSRPSAQISWFKDNRSFEREKVRIYLQGVFAVVPLAV